jgi:hypothetical protein
MKGLMDVGSGGIRVPKDTIDVILHDPAERLTDNRVSENMPRLSFPPTFFR